MCVIFEKVKEKAEVMAGVFLLSCVVSSWFHAAMITVALGEPDDSQSCRDDKGSKKFSNVYQV